MDRIGLWRNQATSNLSPAPEQESFLLPPVETMFWYMEKNCSGSFRVTFLMELDGCIEANHMAAALGQLQFRHPKLRATVAGADHELRFEFQRAAPPIPFEITDYQEGAAPWRETARRLMQAPFPPNGPLAAVSVLRNRAVNRSIVLLTVHHVIADGLSAIYLGNDLLTEYARAEGGERDARPALAAVRSVRAVGPRGWLARFRLIRRLIRTQRRERKQSALPHATGIAPQSQWEHWVLPAGDTLRLVRTCRKAETSLVGVMIAAVCCGLMDCLPVDSATFKCGIPFDLRGSLEAAHGVITNEDLGCFVSTMNEFFDLRAQPDFWDLARQAHQAHRVFFEWGGPGFNYNLAGLLTSPRWAPWVRKLPPSQHRVTMLATNYGVINTRNEYGSLRPRASTITLKNDVDGPALVIESLVMGQQLNVGFASGNLDQAFWERLCVAVRRRLDAAAGVS